MASRIHQVEPHKSALRGVAAVSLFSNESFPRHSHDELGFGLMHSGRHRSWSGVGNVEASQGDIICVNPGEVHDGASIGGKPRGWRIVYVDPVVVERELGAEINGWAEIVAPVIQDGRLKRRFAELFASLTSASPDELDCQEQLLRCLACLLRRLGVRPPKVPDSLPSVTRAIERLHAQPQQRFSLHDLAGASGSSPVQFLRAFARQTGLTPHACLVQLRVRVAQRLLRQGYSVVEASLRSGFADQSHLTGCFVRQLGITPGRYRLAVGGHAQSTK